MTQPSDSSIGGDGDHARGSFVAPADMQPGPETENPSSGPNPAFPGFLAACSVWARIGVLSFGGPAGQIALLHREVVDERRWVGEQRFLHALNFCTLLPGPEAQQLATYLGWLMHGVPGGLAAGLLFILPGAVVMLALSMMFALAGGLKPVAALFFGLKAAVLVLVVHSLIRIGSRALRGRAAWALAMVSFVALFLFAIPFPAVVLTSALVGFCKPRWFTASGHRGEVAGSDALIDTMLASDPTRQRRMAWGARRAALAAFVAWLAPVVVLQIAGGRFAQIAWFFSKMAVVTVGGAYAVLAYVAQDGVSTYHWLSASEMLAGLGLAETTPGPLVLVLQFVGFLAGFRASSGVHGVAGGIAASALTLWVTFVPCFMFVFLGAPEMERLQDRASLRAGLSAVTACVVGVIANLAFWLGLHVLFHSVLEVKAGPISTSIPILASLDPLAAGLALLAAGCIFKLRWSVPVTLAATAATGLVARWCL